MAKPRKPTPNQKAFQAEINRLQKITKKAETKGVVFISTPVPQAPSRITKKQLNIVKGITAEDILSQGWERSTDNNLIPFSREKAQEIIKSNPRAFSATTPLKKGGRIGFPSEKPRLSAEELHRIRSEAAKKAAETRRQRELSDPKYARRMNEIRRANLEKAQEASAKKREEEKQRINRSAEYAAEVKRRRSEIAKKAAETRRQQELADPELARRRALQRAANLMKARKAAKEKAKQPVDPDVVVPKKSKRPKPSTPTEPSYDLPSEGEVLVYNLKSMLQSLSHPIISEYLLLLLGKLIEEDPDALYARLTGQVDRVNELITGINTASTGKGVEENAYALAYLMLGGNVSKELQEEIGTLSYF